MCVYIYIYISHTIGFSVSNFKANTFKGCIFHERSLKKYAEAQTEEIILEKNPQVFYFFSVTRPLEQTLCCIPLFISLTSKKLDNQKLIHLLDQKIYHTHNNHYKIESFKFCLYKIYMGKQDLKKIIHEFL